MSEKTSTVRSLTSWRREAYRIVTVTLAELRQRRPQATDAEKRLALRVAYPWGERRNYPYRCWCDAVRAALGPVPRKPKPGTLAVPPDAPADLAGLLTALHADPGDATTQRVLCDWLEEAGDCRAAGARHCLSATVSVLSVARVMYPRGRTGTKDGKSVFHACDGTGAHYPLAFLIQQVWGQSLLVDPAVTRAVAVVHGRLLLDFVLGEEEKSC